MTPDVPTIPADLLRFEADRWLPLVAGAMFPELAARECWRQQQDVWSNLHGLDRAQFERLAMLQSVV